MTNEETAMGKKDNGGLIRKTFQSFPVTLGYILGVATGCLVGTNGCQLSTAYVAREKEQTRIETTTSCILRNVYLEDYNNDGYADIVIPTGSPVFPPMVLVNDAIDATKKLQGADDK